ncbi:MAG: hypothetical protein EA392_02145 [Cryomorphaceae bacterium]|nr:MAG: hypothetical protein EA392_02145 [Cryomorphaceae bacterium]
MNWLKDIFTYPLFTAGDFDFTLLKLILIALIIFLTRKAVIFYRRFVTNLFRRNDWIDDERAGFMRKYGTYTLIILAAFFSFAGLGLWELVEAFMSFTFFESRETRFKFSVGNIFIIVAIFVVAGFIARMVRIVIKKNLLQRDWIDKGKEFTIFKLSTYFIYTVAFIVAVESIGADLSSLVLASAALLVGVGIGLQYLFADVVSGFILLFEGTFKVGDVIEINGLVARVERIDVRTSKVVTRDGNFIIIPNSTLTRDNLTNWSHSSQLTRFKVETRVAYGSDTMMVKNILQDVATRHPEVSNIRPVIVRFANFGEYAIEFELFFWAIQTWNIEIVKSDLRFEIDKRFREAGIGIPYPQRDLHIKSDDTKASGSGSAFQEQ